MGPAVFEENESTFVVGPGARISLLPEGSILAEYVA
jgi:N-methylhydantoinase A